MPQPRLQQGAVQDDEVEVVKRVDRALHPGVNVERACDLVKVMDMTAESSAARQ